jgi:hypothetical protein
MKGTLGLQKLKTKTAHPVQKHHSLLPRFLANEGIQFRAEATSYGASLKPMDAQFPWIQAGDIDNPAIGDFILEAVDCRKQPLQPLRCR